MGNIFPGAANPAADGEAQPGFFGRMRSMIVKIIIFQLIFKLITNGFQGRPTVYNSKNALPAFNNYFQPGQAFDVFVYTSESPWVNWNVLKQNGNLVWSLYDKKYNREMFSKGDKYNITLPVHSFIDDGIDVYLISAIIPHSAYSRRGKSPKSSKIYEDMTDTVIITSTSLIKIMEPFTEAELQSLMGANEMDVMELEKEAREKAKSTEKEGNTSPVKSQRHLKSRVDIGLVFDKAPHTPRDFLPVGNTSITISPSQGKYLPIVVHSEFWIVERDLILLNKDQKNSTQVLKLSFDVFSLWFWALQIQFDTALSTQASWGMHSRRESYMLKRIILDTNPYFFAFSIAFMLLHSFFSFFAFKNDLQFWHNNDSMIGLSSLSLISNLVCEVIIGLYLFDSRETSWLILFEILISVAISSWKITKAVKTELCSNFPFVKFKNAKEYVESKTKEYDEVAIKWMCVLLLPCVVGYAVYALYKFKYRSWYSYCISVLAGVVYTFGFIMMTPQLYINYKLKSVDHLPWRAMMYKSLNTFVDDVASFLIDMPWMHRLSCFRDDVIFVVYLYQRWIYKVDKTRYGEWVVRDGTISEPLATPPPAEILPPPSEEEKQKISPIEEELVVKDKNASTVTRRGKDEPKTKTTTVMATSSEKDDLDSSREKSD